MNINTSTMTPDEVHAVYMADQPNLRCPCSYAYDTDEAAWFGMAGHYVIISANGVEGDERDSIDSCVSMAVNDSSELIELIANNWEDIPDAVRDWLAEDLSGFVARFFDYLVAPDELTELAAELLSQLLSDNDVRIIAEVVS